MVRIRPDIKEIRPYVPGRRLEEVAAEIGLVPDQIVKLASNESPEGPFPGVVEALGEHLRGSNRYPDNDAQDLRGALGSWLGVDDDHLWLGAGSTSLLTHAALAVGGPGTMAVFAWPSFLMYRVVSKWAISSATEVPLTSGFVHDLDAMRESIGEDTTVVYLCNPNNPTGTVVPAESMRAFVESVPPGVLVVIDEAYHDFVDDPSYSTAIPLTTSHPNVMVLRTFSKIYSLAAHRVGYAVAQPELLEDLVKAQPPFTVSQLAQVAATVSLGQPQELRRRALANAAGRAHLQGALSERAVTFARSQTNFVYCRLGEDSSRVADAFLRLGVIIRPMSRGWVRVTVGTPEENARFVTALDSLGPSLRA